jgi:hypothetical protein
MPVGKSALAYVATPSAVFSVSLPDGAVAVASQWARRDLSPWALFCREPSELLLCLGALGSGPRSHQAQGEAMGALVQLT